MKITQADAPTIRMDCHPSRLIGALISAIPTIFTPDALPGTTLPIYRGLDRHQICWLAYPVAWSSQDYEFNTAYTCVQNLTTVASVIPEL